MKSLLSVARFEWQYHRHRPVTYLFAGLIFGQGFWQAFRVAAQYPGSHLTTEVYFALSSPGVVLAMVCVLLAGQSLTKDQTFRAAPYLYTLPVTSRSYGAGRFVGTLLVTLMLALFYPLGSLVSFSYQHPSTPLLWLAFLNGFAVSMVENVFIMVTVAFSLTILLRGIRGAYAALFLVVFYFLLTETQAGGVAESDLWQLLDPFGVGMVRESIEAMHTAEDVGTELVLSDMLLINRLLWLGLSIGLLAQAEKAFSFQEFSQEASGRRRRAVEMAEKQLVVTARPIHFSFNGWSRFRLLVRLAKLDLLTLVRQPLFWITTGLLVLLTVLLATVFNQNENFPALPLTSDMTALRLPMGVFISLFLLVMTGELLFQERTAGLWPIIDALPQPAFVGITAKLLALAGLTLLLTGTLFLTEVAVQVSAGFWDIDWSLYTLDLTMDGLLRYCQLIALSAFVAAVVNNRITSHVISVPVYLLLWVGYQAGSVEVKPYLYSFLPGSDTYSNLTGYGANGTLRLLTHLLWWGMAGCLGTLAVLLWNRGTPVNFLNRIKAGLQRVSWPYGVSLFVCAMVIGVSGWGIERESGKSVLYRTAVAPVNVRSGTVVSISGKSIRIDVVYHNSYQVDHILNAARSALRRGEQLFGAYPQPNLQIVEVPDSPNPIRSAPGTVWLSEKQGWTANYRLSTQLDYIDYLISREVFNQWLTHRMHPVPQPGDGFLRQSLADYLALRILGERYGPDRLKQRLAQRSALYTTSRNRAVVPEVSLLQSSGNDALERGRAALMLSSIGQVWSDTALSRTIGRFYRSAVQQPTSATATAFAQHLTRQLPDSLRYLTTYLTDRLWFSFSIGRIANLPNGLSVEVFPKKWSDDNAGNRQPLPINDLIPLTVFDRDNQPIYNGLVRLYSGLVRPEPDEPWVRLPALAKAATVQIDPFGTWPETAKRDNRKIF